MQGGSPGRVVTGDDSWQEVVGWNPTLTPNVANNKWSFN